MAGAEADLVVANAAVYTMDASRSRARAFAVGNGRFLAVGTNQQAERFAGKTTKTMDLGGKTVVPGFIDAHAHAMDEGGRESWIDLGSTASLGEALGRIRAAAQSAREATWVVAKNWNESKWPDRRYLTRADLDGASMVHPILACRIDMHMASVNSAALRAAGVPVDAAGYADGIVKEEAFGLVRDSVGLDAARLADAFPAVQSRLHGLGITAVHDMVSPPMVEAYQRVRHAGRLTIRALLNPYIEGLDHLARVGLRTGFGDDALRLGPLKAFSDGKIGRASCRERV